MAGSAIQDMGGRKTRRTRRTKSFPKRYAFHTNAITITDLLATCCVKCNVTFDLTKTQNMLKLNFLNS